MNNSVINKTSEYFQKKGIVLPKISELAEPHTIKEEYKNKLNSSDLKSSIKLSIKLIIN